MRSSSMPHQGMVTAAAFLRLHHSVMTPLLW